MVFELRCDTRVDRIVARVMRPWRELVDQYLAAGNFEQLDGGDFDTVDGSNGSQRDTLGRAAGVPG